MKNLQAEWRQSSVQIAEAQEEAQSFKAELEELQERRSAIEKELSDLETTIDEDQRARASHLRQRIRETASLFSDRSRFYAALQSGDLFDAKKIKEEKEAITFYEKAHTEAMKGLLQPGYEQALKNQEERQKASSLEPIEAGKVLHKKGEQRSDIYLTALTDSTGGLANNLTKAVHAAVQASGVSSVENNVEDLLRITVEGDHQGLFEELEKIKPEGFKEAQVEYHVIILGEERAKAKNRKRKHYEVIEVDEIPAGWVHTTEAAEIAGFNRTNFYKYTGDGRIEAQKYKLKSSTVKPKMYINMNSLEEFLKSRGKRTEEEQSTNTVQSLSPLSAQPLSEQNGESAYTAEMEVEEELESIVQTPDTPQGREGIQQLSQAQKILGDEKFTQYAATYGIQKVEEVVGMVLGLGEERAKILFQADQKGTLFREQGLPLYIGRANGVLSEIDRKYGSDAPSEFSFEEKPISFFPANLSAIKKQLEAISIKPKPIPAQEILDKMVMSPEMARKLTEEGWGPVYVFSMFTEAMDLTKAHPMIGEHYFPRRHWQNNYRGTFKVLGSPVSEKAIAYHERKFKSLGLLYEKKSPEICISLSPRWSSLTQECPALRGYFVSVMHPKR